MSHENASHIILPVEYNRLHQNDLVNSPFALRTLGQYYSVHFAILALTRFRPARPNFDRESHVLRVRFGSTL